GLPALRAAVKDTRKQIRQTAAMALGWIGPSARPAASALVEALTSPDRYLRESAAFALGTMVADKAAVPALLKALQDPVPEVRTYAAFALGRIGSSTKKTETALAALLEDQDEQVRRFAALALPRLDPDHKVARVRLGEALPKVVDFLDGARHRAGL